MSTSTFTAVVVLVSYASLLVELFMLRVPSVASSARIWSATEAASAGFSGRYRGLIESGRLAKGAMTAVPLLAVYAVFAFPLVVLARGPDPLGDYAFVPTVVVTIAGAALMIVGRALSLLAAVALMSDLSPGGEPTRLQTAGPFYYSRNPGLVGMYLFVAGIWLTMPSGLLMLGIVVYALYMDFKVRMEEDYLERRFAARYRDYRSRTRRYL